MLSWMDMLKDNIIKIEDLDNVLQMSPDEKQHMIEVSKRHPMRITKYYFDLIDWSDKNDPIRKLSVPHGMELNDAGDYDTSGEATNTKMPGLQHKYTATALVLTTNVCYMYCRHCFRKRMIGYSTEEVNHRMTESISYIRDHHEINNVLLSGGDFFTISNKIIEKYLKNLSSIDHLDFIRLGSRTPVVFPQRIYLDEDLLNILQKYASIKETIVITQFNHPKELTEEAKKAIDALKNIGIAVRNQAVLLKGINDDPDVMAKLLSGLTAMGVHPYYVFQCRPVRFVKSHFQVPLYEGIEIISEAKSKLNGISKGFRYALSHPDGKIEIFGKTDSDFIFKFHQNKNDKDNDRLFMQPIHKTATWLDNNLKPIE
ncbi:MAG: L-lysine 2,3-aminomutase [Clostridiales bacterium 38_11]|nr:MAG: L-lysine 2,3-aminomutase [Clostridiales bacterium 38_11]